jgi:hypothetical protein
MSRIRSIHPGLWIEAAGIILKYEMAGKSYGAVRNFCQFQRPKKPNSTYPQTDAVRNWVNTQARSTRDGSEPVGNQLPTEEEKPRQMEDGGWRMEDDSSNEPSSAATKRGNGGKTLIPADWEAPSLADLPPRAQACAKQWTSASYATEAEAFVCYWRSERKMKADWAGTWANRIVARHSAIMRDQKFGDAPTDTPIAIDETPAVLLERAAWFEKHGMNDQAAEKRRKAVSLGAIVKDLKVAGGAR